MIQNKYIIRLSFIGLFLNIIFNIIVYRYFIIEKIILKEVINQNNRIAEIYKQKIWNKNLAAVAKLKNNDYKNLLLDQDFINFANDSAGFFENTDSHIVLFDGRKNKYMVSSNLTIIPYENYDNDNIYEILLNQIDHYFLKEYLPVDILQTSFLGKTNHVLFSKTIINPEKNSSRASFVSSYIPIIDNNYNGFLVEGLIEINTDITEQWNNISYLQKRVFITFLIIFIIFFIIVIYNTSYAQRIINKQFEANRELAQAKFIAESESHAKTEFLANVSHELRTPLNAVIGFSEIMLTETQGKIENNQYKVYIQDINNSGKHLLSVINDILDYSKASADKLKVELIELDLNKLAVSSMRFVKPRADEAKVQLLENLPKEHIIIMADPKRLKQALLNLLSNSVKFTPENGSVTMLLEIDRLEKIVYIKVIDTGIGMNEKDIPKALSTFGQIDNKLSRKYEGTGLGLPLTKKLIELMNGKFDLQSTVGVGTTVIITFKYIDLIEI